MVCALLVGVEGSAPLEPGASMLVSDRDEVEGTITGGCVEGAVVAEARSVLAGADARTLSFGFSDELAGTVGLTCGGTVDVFVHELAGAAADVEVEALEAVRGGRPVAIATLLDGPGAGAKLALTEGVRRGTLGGPELLDHSVARDAAAMLERGRTAIRRYGADGATLGAEVGVHIRSFAPPPQLLLFGATDFSLALARIGSELGFRPTICDPREPFVRAPRFEEAAGVVVGWPDAAFSSLDLGPRDAVLILTHDPKFDEPAVAGALSSEAGYVGALGSRKTTAERNRRLLEAGLEEDRLARLHAPCGLDIGSGTPEEVAISVLAEIIASRSGRAGKPLREASGPIHPERA